MFCLLSKPNKYYCEPFYKFCKYLKEKFLIRLINKKYCTNNSMNNINPTNQDNVCLPNNLVISKIKSDSRPTKNLQYIFISNEDYILTNYDIKLPMFTSKELQQECRTIIIDFFKRKSKIQQKKEKWKTIQAFFNGSFVLKININPLICDYSYDNKDIILNNQITLLRDFTIKIKNNNYIENKLLYTFIVHKLFKKEKNILEDMILQSDYFLEHYKNIYVDLTCKFDINI